MELLTVILVLLAAAILLALGKLIERASGRPGLPYELLAGVAGIGAVLLVARGDVVRGLLLAAGAGYYLMRAKLRRTQSRRPNVHAPEA